MLDFHRYKSARSAPIISVEFHSLRSARSALIKFNKFQSYRSVRTARIIQDELDKKKGKGAKTKKLDLAEFEDQLTKITDRLKSIKGMKGNLTRARGILKVSQKDLDKIKEGIDEYVEELLKLLRKAKS